ncbi:SLC13 family permease [Bellilinea sp.]|uniref:SLC13 family permease n=1 Tax=Bellilinea sp. TaxID=2838785 RepID=UPI002ADE7218|nr:SLC13 family permease [Bellilinea sp.]
MTLTLSSAVSALLFAICLALIFSEKVHRTIVAVFGAVLMVAFGLMFGFYNEEQAVASVDFNTLGLLFGMMLLVAMLEPTGFFEFLAVWVGKKSKGRAASLLFLLSLVTSLVSMFLDNVTTVVLIAPVTILICEILGFSPQPFLISEAILSNIGGISTLVGDPPNVLIASAAGFTFVDFIIHSFPLIIFVWLSAFAMLSWMFRKELHQPSPNAEAIQSLNPQEAYTDQPTSRKVIVVIVLAIVFFFLEELLEIRPALVALAAASLALIWIRPNISDLLKRIQWEILLFFGGLFVMIGGIQQSGVLDIFTNMVTQLVKLSPALAGLILLWLVAMLSSIVDNIPITITLIPIIQHLILPGSNPSFLWWALVFGAGLGGNGTIIGSTANVVVVGLSERTRLPITSQTWSKRGLPVMLLSLVVISILYLLVFQSFS